MDAANEPGVGGAVGELHNPCPARAASTEPRSMNGIKRLIPNTPEVIALSRSSMSAVSSVGTTMPRPPASATAAASCRVATFAIPACCSGTRQPTSLVNAVSSMCAVLGAARGWGDVVVAEVEQVAGS